ncbi:hypothetical protein [Kocuria coralli]|uniref:hypothetical protein n=1 Tax=Kocuria coralli TaxID=1461025 RepID=UPI0015F2E442|nr:hypothetical protein [Kocuria coralli]
MNNFDMATLIQVVLAGAAFASGVVLLRQAGNLHIALRHFKSQDPKQTDAT